MEAQHSTCLLALSAAPKVTISGAVKTFSSTPRQSRRYQITDRRRGFCFLHTHSHQRFVKAQRRSLRPRYACVYYFYESECTLAAGPELYKYKSILVLIGGEQQKFTAGRNRIYSRAAKTQQRGRRCGHSHFSSSGVI